MMAACCRDSFRLNDIIYSQQSAFNRARTRIYRVSAETGYTLSLITLKIFFNSVCGPVGGYTRLMDHKFL
jgi:hypothetical protein